MKKKINFWLLATVLLATLPSPRRSSRGKVHRIGFLSWGTFPVPRPTSKHSVKGCATWSTRAKTLSSNTDIPKGKPSGSLILFRTLSASRLTSSSGMALAGDKRCEESNQHDPHCHDVRCRSCGHGLIASLARPGGNVTGLSNVSGELGRKLLEILKEIDPRLTRVAIVSRWREVAANKLYLERNRGSARTLGLQAISLVVRGPEDYESAVRAATKERANALLSRLPPGTPSSRRKKFVELAVKSRLPVIYAYESRYEAGGLMSYGGTQRMATGAPLRMWTRS